MKKILFVTTLSGKQLNSFMLSSVIAAKNLGYEFHLACNFSNANMETYKKQAEKFNIKLHQIDFDRSPLKLTNIKAYRQLKKLVLNDYYDIIHTNTPVGGVVGRLVGKKYSKNSKIVYTAHGFHFNKKTSKLNWLMYYPIEKHLSKKTDLLITMNEEDYQVSNKLNAGQIMKINGVGFNDNPTLKNSNVKDVIKVSKETKVLINVGELTKRKNQAIIIKVLTKIPDVHLVIIGFGNLEKKLKKLTAKLNINDRVHFLNYRDDVFDLLKTSDVFVFPSHREGLPLALMEAMAAGLPCVVSNIRGNVDLIDDKYGGYIVNSEAEYISAVTNLLQDGDLVKKMANYNISKAREYSLTKIVEIQMSMYESL